jgi:hypothetical protein
VRRAAPIHAAQALTPRRRCRRACHFGLLAVSLALSCVGLVLVVLLAEEMSYLFCILGAAMTLLAFVLVLALLWPPVCGRSRSTSVRKWWAGSSAGQPRYPHGASDVELLPSKGRSSRPAPALGYVRAATVLLPCITLAALGVLLTRALRLDYRREAVVPGADPDYEWSRECICSDEVLEPWLTAPAVDTLGLRGLRRWHSLALGLSVVTWLNAAACLLAAVACVATVLLEKRAQRRTDTQRFLKATSIAGASSTEREAPAPYRDAPPSPLLPPPSSSDHGSRHTGTPAPRRSLLAPRESDEERTTTDDDLVSARSHASKSPDHDDAAPAGLAHPLQQHDDDEVYAARPHSPTLANAAPGQAF